MRVATMSVYNNKGKRKNRMNDQSYRFPVKMYLNDSRMRCRHKFLKVNVGTIVK